MFSGQRIVGEPLSWFLGVFSIAFAFLGISNFRSSDLSYLFSVLGAVITGTIVHEYMHRREGQRHGCLSEYVVTPFGVLVTMLSGFLPILILIPGYTLINCPHILGVRTKGVIAAVGPASNLVLGYLALIPGIFVDMSYMLVFARVNLWLSLFNLLPVYPLDGSKIISWNKVIWGLMFAASLPVFYI